MANPALLAIGTVIGLTLFHGGANAHGHMVEKGEKLYQIHCASCHGIDGDGQGKAGQHLSPPPANLHEALQGKIISDEYLLWTIREGGKNVHTDMPSFEDNGTITESDAKAIVRYLWHAFK